MRCRACGDNYEAKLKKASSPIDVYYQWIDFKDEEREKEYDNKIKDEEVKEGEEQENNDNNEYDNEEENEDENYDDNKMKSKYDEDDEDY